MDIKNANYMVASATIADDVEGHVIFCKTLQGAMALGKQMAESESDPAINIWENTSPGEWTLVLEGYIPCPEFAWHAPNSEE